MLTSTRKMEESLSRLKKARGGKDGKTGGMKDSDKIRTQIVIDISSFHNQVGQLKKKYREEKRVDGDIQNDLQD